jgi:hypothetical protein
MIQKLLGVKFASSEETQKVTVLSPCQTEHVEPTSSENNQKQPQPAPREVGFFISTPRGLSILADAQKIIFA